MEDSDMSEAVEILPVDSLTKHQKVLIIESPFDPLKLEDEIRAAPGLTKLKGKHGYTLRQWLLPYRGDAA
jgi:hypothetical protein